jgi:O-antigen/teichoic acid export membrane protein
MGRDIFSLAKHTSIYTVGVVLSKLVGFVMIPLYTRMLTPADYGILELMSMTTDVIALLVGLGLSSAVMRHYYAYEEGPDRQKVVSTAFVMAGLLVLTAAAVAFPFSTRLAAAVLGDEAYAGLFRIALASFAISAGLEIPFVYLRARQLSARVVSVNLVRLGMSLSLNVLFLVVLRMGVEGVLIANLISTTVIAAYLAVGTVRDVGFAFSWPMARGLIRYGAPLVLVEIGSFVISFSDRYFIRGFESLEAVGLYSLAYRFAILISVFVASPFGQIWAAKSMEMWGKPNSEKFFGDTFRYFNAVLLAVTVGIALFTTDVIRFLSDPAFASAGEIVPLLAFAYVFFAYRQFSYIGIYISKKSEWAAAATWVSVGLVLGLNMLLIPRMGAYGAAIATLSAFAVEFVLTMLVSQRLVRVRYPWARILSLLAVAAVATAIVVPASLSMTPLPAFSLKATVYVLFVLVAIPFLAFDSHERRRLLASALNPVAGLQALRSLS